MLPCTCGVHRRILGAGGVLPFSGCGTEVQTDAVCRDKALIVEAEEVCP